MIDKPVGQHLYGALGVARGPRFRAGLLNLLAQASAARAAHPAPLSTALEIIVITLFAMLVGAPYLNLDPEVIPTGREFPSHVQSHHMWTRAATCGLCALWNGTSQGGAPMLVDVHGSMLHPYVVISTVLFGVINGTKITVIASLMTAGFGQWWLANQLHIGRIARVWTSLAAIAGGHLAGRMENGVLGVVIATASCAIALPALFAVVQQRGNRPIVLAAVAIYFVASAGQGYIQIGFTLLLPLFFILAEKTFDDLRVAIIRVSTTVLISLLLFGIFLVPFLHFYPQFYKDVDPTIKSGQRYLFSFLNFVIDDPQFFRVDALGKLPFPNLYTTFIGIVPVAFALGTLYIVPEGRSPAIVIFLALYAGMAVWISTGTPLLYVATVLPFRGVTDFVASIRYPTYISGLAVQPILALAGIGFQRIYAFHWPQFVIDFANTASKTRLGFSSNVILILLIASNIGAEVVFASKWTQTARQDPGFHEVLRRFRTDSLQWVGPPFGEHFWSEIATGMNLKMYQGVRPWKWAGRELPSPVIDSNRSGVPNGMVLRETVKGVPIYEVPSGREYAAVVGPDGQPVACRARGIGGDITVACSTIAGGTLVVTENYWPGWSATVNGAPAAINSKQWMSIPVGPGEVEVELRYRPWDVALGALLTLAGALLCMRLWVQDAQGQSALTFASLDHARTRDAELPAER